MVYAKSWQLNGLTLVIWFLPTSWLRRRPPRASPALGVKFNYCFSSFSPFQNHPRLLKAKMKRRDNQKRRNGRIRRNKKKIGQKGEKKSSLCDWKLHGRSSPFSERNTTWIVGPRGGLNKLLAMTFGTVN